MTAKAPSIQPLVSGDGLAADLGRHGVRDEALGVRLVMHRCDLLARSARGSPANATFGRSVTCVIASLPAAFLPMTPRASST